MNPYLRHPFEVPVDTQHQTRGVRVTPRPEAVIVVHTSDDSADVRSALSRVISAQADLRLAGAANGPNDGIALAQAVNPDVLVVDVQMPDGGGLRVTREMAATMPGVRIVAYSAFDKALIKRVMSTAGGVVFAGTEDGYFKALDAGSGKELWHINLGGRVIASPMSFAVDREQRVAIAAGSGLYILGLRR